MTTQIADVKTEEKAKRTLPAGSPFIKPPFGGISATTLKILAVVLMLSDHLWATVVSGNNWMTYIGRMAFPIFAFQAAEGVVHTRNFKKYALRMLIFALVSEVPFNLIMESSPFFPFHQNVMFTLLFGILGAKALGEGIKKKTAKSIVGGIAIALAFIALGAVGMTDYGGRGVATVILFYLCRDFPFAWVGQLAGLAVMFIFTFKGYYIELELFGKSVEFVTQGFCLLGLLPIWLYNGKKGKGGKALQYGVYAFYPVHMLLLYLISL